MTAKWPFNKTPNLPYSAERYLGLISNDINASQLLYCLSSRMRTFQSWFVFANHYRRLCVKLPLSLFGSNPILLSLCGSTFHPSVIVWLKSPLLSLFGSNPLLHCHCLTQTLCDGLVARTRWFNPFMADRSNA